MIDREVLKLYKFYYIYGFEGYIIGKYEEEVYKRIFLDVKAFFLRDEEVFLEGMFIKGLT